MQDFSNVEVVPLSGVSSNGNSNSKSGPVSSVSIKKDLKNGSTPFSISIKQGTSQLLNLAIRGTVDCIRSGANGVVISFPQHENLSYLLKFQNNEDLSTFGKLVRSIKSEKSEEGGSGDASSCLFDERTEESSAVQYFQFYGYLSQQQNMMQDYVRTSTYQRAILDNSVDFQDKVVLDVGAGSGILSFFAAQAGARKVYAVEASSMAQHAQALVTNNHLASRIQVITGKIEEINLPEQVDVIISEPMGYMLFNERMLETYLHAKKWLKPQGKMFPTSGDLYVTPFTDEGLYMEQVGKANFWYQQSFYGVDLTTLRDAALDEYFKQPIVDNFDVRICLARPIKHTVDFLTANEEDLYEIKIPLSFQMTTTAVVHGLAFWFDVCFDGTTSQVWLSTAPTQPLTHWYQVRCLFMKPITVNHGQIIKGHATLHSNRKQSYDVEMVLQVDGTNISAENTLDLKNPYFRYPNQPLQVPPGQYHESPTDQYWNGLPADQAQMAAGGGQMMHPNANPYSPNCNINNNLSAHNDGGGGDYDGSEYASQATFQPRFGLPTTTTPSSVGQVVYQQQQPQQNHSDRTSNAFSNNTTFNPNLTMSNGFGFSGGQIPAAFISQQPSSSGSHAPRS